ncbi:Uncharacterised protein [Serratia plymuthica]|nr:Uncharacterised protein [Serratia plymuthica]
MHQEFRTIYLFIDQQSLIVNLGRETAFNFLMFCL